MQPDILNTVLDGTVDYLEAHGIDKLCHASVVVQYCTNRARASEGHILEIVGAQYIADLVWYNGFLVSFLVFVAASKIWPAKDSLLERASLLKDPGLALEGLRELPSKVERDWS